MLGQPSLLPSRSCSFHLSEILLAPCSLSRQDGVKTKDPVIIWLHQRENELYLQPDLGGLDALSPL